VSGAAVVRGKQYLTKREQYESVYNSGNYRANKELVIRVLSNNLDFSRYGITVSRRVGKAVVRNRIKRRLREIIRQVPLPPGFDIVFIARAAAALAGYAEMKKSAGDILFRAGLLMGEYEETGTRTD
jgi:ribonuclease P protein component